MYKYFIISEILSILIFFASMALCFDYGKNSNWLGLNRRQTPYQVVIHCPSKLQWSSLRCETPQHLCLRATTMCYLIHHVTARFALGITSVHEMYPKRFSDICVLRAESFLFLLLLLERFPKIRLICFEEFLQRLYVNFAPIVSPRYCKSIPFNFTMLYYIIARSASRTCITIESW